MELVVPRNNIQVKYEQILFEIRSIYPNKLLDKFWASS